MIESPAAKARTRTSKPPGLIVSTIAWDRDRYIGNFYDVAKHSIVRLLWGLAEELREHSVATVALAPGFMRTERVRSHAGGETDWKKIPWLKKSESPEYIGRAVAALAGDPHVMRKSGKTFHVGELTHEYRFSDIDGSRVPPFRIVEPFVRMVKKFEKIQRTATTSCETCMGIIFPLGITCSTPARRSRSSEWTCRCGWRSVLPRYSRIWPSTSA